MKPKLLITKRKDFRKPKRGKRREVTRFFFSVVDAEIEKPYPFNYVCIFPVEKASFRGRERTFAKIFGKGFELPLKLLRIALKEYALDPEIKAEIERRIEKLEIKPYEGKRKKVRITQEAIVY